MTLPRRLIVAAVLMLVPLIAAAQDVTLRLHYFLPDNSFVPANILTPWADRIEAESGGRIKVDRYPSMALGGRPADLVDQVTDGVADVVWTLPGYTPGRFPQTEVAELPFMSRDAGATSAALWGLAQGWQDSDFRNLHLLGIWVHGPGVIHSARPVAVLPDMAGLKLRAPSRAASMLLEKAGAAPIGMPAPAVPEALSKGVIDGALLPWEVTSSVRVQEFVQNHTEFEGPAIYNAVLMLVMNQGVYDRLPDDLKTVIDEASGAAFSRHAGAIQQNADQPQRAATLAAGGTISTIGADQIDQWHALGDQVIADWSAAARGFDGAALVEQARAAIAAAEAEGLGAPGVEPVAP
ncbi:MAG: TRAP transporter substrate-binding protein [Paracoccus sp. (in: a-proteobacteria)]|uniref:TRAP transporter substrate-binding protein n=1 Tax=Paracoccus sp. TaxID=267 RepID=UPI0026E0CF63|nr:TRAP transporter substrate-binding protein [Paracoccus sp. (in: a-proteobacteria)]MDO5613833.1 TRAP transporter substrate-binding protein [Paracoccus sp. (in: a-proteobacteria)]